MANTPAVPTSNFPDSTVQNEGSIFLLHPHTDAARSWIEEHIGEANGYQPYRPTVLIEPRYVASSRESNPTD
jgi:hypothetical protein